MSERTSSNLLLAAEFIAISLLLSVLPFLSYAVGTWWFYLDLGMRRTAFYYFLSTLDDRHLIWTFCLALAAIVSAHALLSLRHQSKTAVDRRRHYFIAALLLLSLALAGYRLNRVPWYPDPLSVQGAVCNAMLVLCFAAVGLILSRRRPGANIFLGMVMVMTLLAPNVYFQYCKAVAPVVFTDVAEQVGLTELDNSLGVAWGDYDNDGWLDVYISNHLPASTKSLLYRNDRGSFSITRAMATGDMHGAAWADFDNDGDQDVFAAGGNDTPKGPPYPNVLFRNENGKFTDVAPAVGVDETLGRAWGGTWADVDNDGLLDLFVVNYFSSNDLFINAGNGAFHNVAKAAGLSVNNPGEPNKIGTLGASWGDYDSDGDMDLVTAGIQSGVALYRNDGKVTFSNVTASAGVLVGGDLGTESYPKGPTGCAWGDYDNDGDLDLFIAWLTGKIGRNLLFQNTGSGVFVEVGKAAGVDASLASRAVMWGDFDNDGYLDLFLVNEAADEGTGSTAAARGWNTLYLNRGDGTFAEANADALGVAGFPFVREGTGTIVDYDNDGFLDIFVDNQGVKGHTRYLRRNLLLRNSGNDNHWLKIQLHGTTSNRDGIGAKVTLSAGGRQQFRERGGESHTFAQNTPIVHFGLGNLKQVDSVRIQWPSGITQTLNDIAANQLLTVTEPAKQESATAVP